LSSDKLKVPFFRLKLSQAEIKSVTDTLNSGWVTTGPKTRQFENRIKKIAGTKYAAAVSSCTAGMHLTLKALDIGPGDEVITTPYTMAATIEPVIYCGAKPVFADIDPMTLTIDPDNIEKQISRKTKAIIAVDIAGNPCDYRRLRAICRKYKLRLIADAAHSLGALYYGKPSGTLADASVLSFYPTKTITAGEGGMVVTNSKRLAEKIRLLSLHGMSSSGWKRASGGSWKYDICDLGYKYNMSDLAASLGLGQLLQIKTFLARRKQLTKRYVEKLGDLSDMLELPLQQDRVESAWHLFVIKMNLSRWKIGRDRLIEELEKRGVGCGVHYIPIYRLTYFKKKYRLKVSDYPACEKSFKRVISLPLYPDLTQRELYYVCKVIKELADLYRK
jgi:dTDP-4-amino-4,6-dideoxygalactose transaminase